MRRFVLLVALMVAVKAGAAMSAWKYDVNEDGEVNVADVTTLVNVILGTQECSGGDINGDGERNVADVTLLVNHILGMVDSNGHDYVDLGLPSGTLWATVNVGATRPEESGDYFAWGETSAKSSYTWKNYSLCDGTERKLNRYNSDSSYGQVDGLAELQLADDAAQVNWGGDWHIPTKAQAQELKYKCTWELDTVRKCYRVTGPNGNSIVMPLSGYMKDSSVYLSGSSGYYWTADVSPSVPYNAYCLLCEQSLFEMYSLRQCGRSIRPVAE